MRSENHFGQLLEPMIYKAMDIERVLEACIQFPDDDEPRRAWASLVGGARGEFVHVQCDLARGGLTPKESGMRRRRQRDLIAENAAALSPVPRVPGTMVFRRGFVDAIDMNAQEILAKFDGLMRALPFLLCLTISGLSSKHDLTYDIKTGPEPLEQLRQILALPVWPHLQGVYFSNIGWDTERDSEFDPYGDESLDDEAAAIIASSGVCKGLRAFGMDSVSPRGLKALVAGGVFDSVERLWLPNATSREALDLLFAPGVLPNVHAIMLRGGQSLPELAERLPSTIRELELGGISQTTLEQLGAGPVAKNVELVRLHHGRIQNASPFAAFPKLHSLDLSDTLFGHAGYSQTQWDTIGTFTRTRLPALRELRLSDIAPTSDGWRTVVAAFGKQLELFDLRGQWRAKQIADEIRTMSVGDAWFGEWKSTNQPLFVGSDAPSPWWDVGIVQTS